MRELTFDEIDAVAGGVDAGTQAVAGGIVAIGAAIGLAATAPVSVPVIIACGLLAGGGTAMIMDGLDF